MSSDLTDEEKLERIRDAFRGYPRKHLEDFAREIDVDYDELMWHARMYVRSNGDHWWSEGPKFESLDLPKDFWNWYELVTGEVVKQDLRYSFFSCSC